MCAPHACYARHLAERHPIAARYAQLEIVDPPGERTCIGVVARAVEVGAADWLLSAVDSTDRRNSLVESFGWCVEV